RTHRNIVGCSLDNTHHKDSATTHMDFQSRKGKLRRIEHTRLCRSTLSWDTESPRRRKGQHTHRCQHLSGMGRFLHPVSPPQPRPHDSESTGCRSILRYTKEIEFVIVQKILQRTWSQHGCRLNLREVESTGDCVIREDVGDVGNEFLRIRWPRAIPWIASG